MPTTSVGSSFIDPSLVEHELSALARAPSIDVAALPVSLEKLTDRAFELLLYSLCKAGDSPTLRLSYDDVQLLPSGPDRGRDIVLLEAGVPITVVQCKKHSTRMSLPHALDELSRVILASMVDPTILPPSKAFSYVLAASGGLSESSQRLFKETTQVVATNETLIRQRVHRTRRKYASLSGIDDTKAADHVVSVLNTAILQYLTSDDIALWLREKQRVYAQYFEVRTVIDTQVIEEKLDQLSTAILKEANDQRKQGVDGWYHPASAAVFSVVSRRPGSERGSPIVLDEVYVPRKLEITINDWLGKATSNAEGVIVAVVAPGGYGKTSLLWHMHRDRQGSPGHHAFLINAALVVSKVDSATFDKSLASLVDYVGARASEGNTITVCIDTFDVLAHRMDLQQAGLRLISGLVAAGASVLMSSRPEEVALIPIEQLTAISVRLYLGEYDEEEFAAAVKSHCHAFYSHSDLTAQQVEDQVQRLQSLVALGRPVKEVCLNPLTLRMLFELYAPNEVPEDINSFRLYSQYWAVRVSGDVRMAGSIERQGRDLARSVYWIASTMLDAGAPLISVDQLTNGEVAGDLHHTDGAELLSRNLLVRSGDGSLEFFHQTFFEHAAARYLDAVEHVSLDECVARMREGANDNFRLPVHEQLFLLHAGRSATSSALERHVGALLIDSHPGLMAVGLHAHMVSERGYETGRRFIEAAARTKSTYILKRFSKLIYNLRRNRVPEVVALIDASWPPSNWKTVEPIAGMFIWLAQSCWPVCKTQLEKCDLIGALSKTVPDNSVDSDRIVVSVLWHGVPDDATWSFSQALRGARNARHTRAALEFVQDEVHRAGLPAAKEAQRLIVEMVLASPDKHRDDLLDAPSRCLARIWQTHPVLAPSDLNTVLSCAVIEKNLMLRALSMTHIQATSSIRLALVDLAAQETRSGPLHELLHQFIVPLMAGVREVDLAVWQRSCDACELLLRVALIGTDSRTRVASSAIKELYLRGAPASNLWRIISDVRCNDWLQPRGYLHLFPIAVAEGSSEAELAFSIVCSRPKIYHNHASILKGALPSFAKTSIGFKAVLQLAAATTDAQLLLAYFHRAIASAEWTTLATVAFEHRQQLLSIAQGALTARADAMRVAAMLLLAMLAKHGLIVPTPHEQVMAWLSNERKADVRASALPLLVAATGESTLSATVIVLLRAASDEKPSAFNQVVDQLREVLAMPGARLSDELRMLIVKFALRSGAIEPQVSIAGRVIDLCINANAIDAAQETALSVLRSDTVRALSATQKRSLGHHLDKPFLSLYRRLSNDALLLHVNELAKLDENMGRLVVVSLCKSERQGISDILNIVIDTQGVHPSLKGIIQDYRQFLWRR